MSSLSNRSPPAGRTPLVLAARGERREANGTPVLPPWKVMVSDDDEDVHLVSRIMLKDFSFEGRPLHLIGARSAAETRVLIREHPDTAVLLLDVVMETEQAGLDLVRHIRDELANGFVRIILRTGQPGQAPEREVVERYDINDYREKTELTAQKLTTTMMSALRSYRDLCRLETSRRGLERIVRGSARLFEHQTSRRFAAAALEQLSALLAAGRAGMAGPIEPEAPPVSGLAAAPGDAGLEVIAGVGAYAGLEAGTPLSEVLPADLLGSVGSAAAHRQPVLVDRQTFTGFFHTDQGLELLVFLRARDLDEVDAHLLRVCAANLRIAFDNILLNRELADTQTEIIQVLSEVVETRSTETSRHTYRVGKAAELLGARFGLPEDQYRLLRQIAPMHDLGKVGIPDAILSKPGPLTTEEYEWVKTHPMIGYNILRVSPRPLLKAASIVCLQHHERWDGGGYPSGLAGTAIDLLARIVGLVDVWDAISHNRPYKTAWPADQVYEYIQDQRGQQFDPDLADTILAHFSEFLALRDDC